MNASQWIGFLRQYGPIPTKENCFDENLKRQARRRGITPILFKHPYEDTVLSSFDPAGSLSHSVVLTGTAGDGKTFLCGQVWERLGGDAKEWAGQDTHFKLKIKLPGGRRVTLHVVRDLSAWVPSQGAKWPVRKRELMLQFCRSIFASQSDEVFLIAANDGQLAETFRRLLPDADVERAKDAIEEMLVSDRSELEGCSLRLHNLSRGSSATLFDLALDAFLAHEGWTMCAAEAAAPDHLFGEACPIRRNYELLKTSLVRARLRALLELCDQNGLHVPVRQLLILLSNGVLGHPDARDHLMSADDVPAIIAAGTRSQASLYNNLFGGNLPEGRRGNSIIFEYLDRFQLGRETSNRFDNILIFGESHEHLQEQFNRLVRSDTFYGADQTYMAARRDYIEGSDDNGEAAERFLDMLISQRRALFFKVPEKEREELNLWELTVFKYGGEYLDEALNVLRAKGTVRRSILGRIVRGANRIFTGMLINSEDELFLASSASLSQARVSRILDERLSVTPRHGGEKVEVILENDRPYLHVALGGGFGCKFQLTLTRYEYLSRVAEGAMPNSFSKECFEDLLAFKGRLMRELGHRDPGSELASEIVFRVLDVDAGGQPKVERIGVRT